MNEKPMTMGELRNKTKDIPDNTPINFECSCSSSGGYDYWVVKIEITDSYLDIYLDGQYD
jgi:hypothetical protein